MRLILYTDKTVSQCMTALTERMQAKATKTRPGIEGWVEKKGSFSISVTQPVLRFFRRTTRLSGQAERHSGYTMITGRVAEGASRRTLILIYVAMLIAAVALIVTGNTLLGAALFPVALLIYVPLAGDYENSEVLIGELQKTLKAKFQPPKSATSKAKARSRRA